MSDLHTPFSVLIGVDGRYFSASYATIPVIGDDIVFHVMEEEVYATVFARTLYDLKGAKPDAAALILASRGERRV